MDTKKFKKLLKESIRSDGYSILNQVLEMDYTDGDAVLGSHYEDDLQKATKKFKNKDTNRVITGWQKASPETLERYLKASQRIRNAYNTLANRRKSMDDKQWLEDFVKLFNLDLENEDGKNTLGYDKKFNEPFLNFIDKSFGDKQDPLGFEKFRKSMVNWNKNRVKNEGDFWKIEKAKGDIFLRESLSVLLKENLENDIQNILTYHGKIFLDAFEKERQESSKGKGYESAEEEEELSDKMLGKLANKMDAAKEEIEKASEKLTSDNIYTLVRYAMYPTLAQKPEQIKTNHDRFGAYMEKVLEQYLSKDGANIKMFMDSMIEVIGKSPFWTEPSIKMIKQIKQKKMQKLLYIMDDTLSSEPHGYKGPSVSKFINDNIKDYIEGEKGLTQSQSAPDTGEQESSDVVSESVHMKNISEYLESFLPFAKKRLKYDKDPKIDFISDKENAKMPLGKTAYYEPASMTVTVYTDNRHPKDIMRSLSHELVHHTQNCDGQFDGEHDMESGYAQKDEHLRKMEEDAYLRGNMCFRDWEDNYKQNNPILERKERLYYKLIRRFK
tara:strand:+ start:5486 stop:7147 length:1662 start_codon:yes stop_codon:yes gene_type:complete